MRARERGRTSAPTGCNYDLTNKAKALALSVATRFAANESQSLPLKITAIIFLVFSGAKTMIACGRRNGFN
jgi:hypothetical protein